MVAYYFEEEEEMQKDRDTWLDNRNRRSKIKALKYS